MNEGIPKKQAEEDAEDDADAATGMELLRQLKAAKRERNCSSC
jgi:hypothetical protein